MDPTGLGEYKTTTDQITNATARYKPAGSPVAAHRKADFTPRIQETENITIYGNVGNVTLDVNGGSSAKDIAASITSRLSETGVSATAQTRMNVSFEEEPNGTQTTDTVSFNVYGMNTDPVLVSANVDFGETNGRGADLTQLAAAIKAGDSLMREEMQELVNRLFSTEHPYYCPHGRPIIVQMSLDELDGRFERH